MDPRCPRVAGPVPFSLQDPFWDFPGAHLGYGDLGIADGPIDGFPGHVKHNVCSRCGKSRPAAAGIRTGLLNRGPRPDQTMRCARNKAQPIEPAPPPPPTGHESRYRNLGTGYVPEKGLGKRMSIPSCLGEEQGSGLSRAPLCWVSRSHLF